MNNRNLFYTQYRYIIIKYVVIRNFQILQSKTSKPALIYLIYIEILQKYK